MRRGASSYVPKRDLARELEATLEQVLAASQVDDQRQRVLGSLTRRDSRFVLENDPALVSPLVALLIEDLTALHICDATGATRVGIALEEALLNALYHGNLEMNSRLKEASHEAFQRQVALRRQLMPYKERRIRILANLTTADATFVIADQGRGFDPSTLPDPTDPRNLERASGRGVLLIRTFMDGVTYSPAGNQVTLVNRREGR